jgi:hypothetical protein
MIKEIILEFRLMPLNQPFSRRNQYSTAKEITVREDAPKNLRYFALQAAADLGWQPSQLRDIVCRVLRTVPDSNNWSDGNMWKEAEWLVERCDWFRVYDIIEAIHALMYKNDEKYRFKTNLAARYAEAVNEFCVEEGIGWQLVNGEIITRGDEPFELVVKEGTTALQTSERPTAASHLHEALQDLSRRPQPDLPGSVYHAMGTLECVARDISGDGNATLGEILKSYPDLLPKPLDEAASKIWGYASNQARHVTEGRAPSREEAALLVGLSAVLSTYLTRKQA